MNKMVALGIMSVLVFAVILVGNGSGASTSSAFEATVIPESAQFVPHEQYPENASSVDAMPVVGIDAIAVTRGGSTGVAAFTADDVRSYIVEHPFPYAAAGKAAPVIESIEFLTADAANVRLGGAMAAGGKTAICLVTFRGDFVVDTGPDRAPYEGTTGYWAFDAATGNLLFESVRP